MGGGGRGRSSVSKSVSRESCRARVADIIGGGRGGRREGKIESEKDSLQKHRLTGLRSIRQLFGIVPKSGGTTAFPFSTLVPTPRNY